MKVVAGLDISLRNTGLAIITPEGMKTFSFGLKIEAPSEKEQLDRIIKIASWVTRKLREHNVEYVAIEDYAFSRNSASKTKLAEVTGVIKVQIVTALKTVPIRLTSTQIRKFVVGNGRAKKEVVQTHLELIGYKAGNADEYDAIAVALLLDEWVNRTNEESWCEYKKKVISEINKKRWR